MNIARLQKQLNAKEEKWMRTKQDYDEKVELVEKDLKQKTRRLKDNSKAEQIVECSKTEIMKLKSKMMTMNKEAEVKQN